MAELSGSAREARRFASGCVASPHYLASAAGFAVLAGGGNALDAAVATSLTLGVVAPYSCGYGGDIFCLIWKDGLHAYNGSGRAPAAATPEAIRAASGARTRVPREGPHPVTVPGAVEGWFALLERFGTRSFEELARTPLRYAEHGFVPTRRGARSLSGSVRRFEGPGFEEHRAVYSRARHGQPFLQPGLARTIRTLCEEGPEPYYRGEIADATASHLQSLGGLMTKDDLAAHHGDWVDPLKTAYRDIEVCELPPNTQGVVALESLNILEGLDIGDPESVERHHALIESCRLALEDRDAYVTDPDHMRIDAHELVSKAWAEGRRTLVDSSRATPRTSASVGDGGTVYLCAADESGMCVSLIQSNWLGFGSGVTVPGWGINLQNRGWSFSLDPSHANVVAPRKRTMHTLVPAMALKDGRPWLVFGTMGGHGQAQIHVQVLTRVVDDGIDVQAAIDGPRWVIEPATGTLAHEARFDRAVVRGLARRGHRLTTRAVQPGHAHAILVDDAGYAGATDPRAEGAVLGL